MKKAIKKLKRLKNTAIDNFEINSINLCIECIKEGKIEYLKQEINYEIENYQHYINYMFFTQLKKAVKHC